MGDDEKKRTEDLLRRVRQLSEWLFAVAVVGVIALILWLRVTLT